MGSRAVHLLALGGGTGDVSEYLIKTLLMGAAGGF
jgi:hypothetical protein